MAKQSLTYAELADIWNVTSEAACKKVEGLRLLRQVGNDGRVRVTIDLDEVHHRPAKQRSDRRAAGDRPETEALRQHVATLQSEVEQLSALADSNRADFERERERAERATADLVVLAGRLADAEHGRATGLAEAEQARIETDKARAETDAVRVELMTWRSRPWWRRALG